MTLDLLGHLFYLSIFIGQCLIARRTHAGWICRLVGDLGWIGIGLALGMTSIWAWGIVFTAVDIRGWIAWKIPYHGLFEDVVESSHAGRQEEHPGDPKDSQRHLFCGPQKGRSGSRRP